MRMVIGNCSEWVCKWVAEQLGQPNAVSGKEYGLAVIHKDEPVAGIVYHDWSDHNVFMSIASNSPYWCSRLVLKQIFGYPFNQMGVSRVSVVVRGDTPERIKWRKRLIHGFGFVFEGRLDDWFGPEKHGYLLRMTRNECRWLDVREGRGRLSAAV